MEVQLGWYRTRGGKLVKVIGLDGTVSYGIGSQFPIAAVSELGILTYSKDGKWLNPLKESFWDLTEYIGERDDITFVMPDEDSKPEISEKTQEDCFRDRINAINPQDPSTWLWVVARQKEHRDWCWTVFSRENVRRLNSRCSVIYPLIDIDDLIEKIVSGAWICVSEDEALAVASTGMDGWRWLRHDETMNSSHVIVGADGSRTPIPSFRWLHPVNALGVLGRSHKEGDSITFFEVAREIDGGYVIMWVEKPLSGDIRTGAKRATIVVCEEKMPIRLDRSVWMK